MNKKEIINILNKYQLEKNKIIMISDTAKVMNNIKDETKNITISVNPDYEKELLKKYKCKKNTKNNLEFYIINDIISFSSNYYEKYQYEKQNDYRIQTLEDVLKMTNSKQEKEIIKKHINIRNTNSLVLAYLGDAIYELYIREYLIKSNKKVKELQSKSIEYVSAKAQSAFLDKMLENNFLNQEEIEIIKRARNHKSHPSKTTNIITYKKSTGLEALIGYLKMTNNTNRIEEIMKYIVGE